MLAIQTEADLRREIAKDKWLKLAFEQFTAIDTKNQGVDWTEEEETFLKTNYSKFTNQQLASSLRRSIETISGKAHRMGIRKGMHRHQDRKTFWLNYICVALGYRVRQSVLSTRLGVPASVVTTACRRLGIIQPDRYGCLQRQEANIKEMREGFMKVFEEQQALANDLL